jgi:hypothetical protein
LIVDGMLTAGTVVLWMTRHSGKGRGRWAAWVTFGVGIALSLSANITAAPELSLFAIMVTGCPPVALLLLIELLNYILTHHHTETIAEKINETKAGSDENYAVPATRLSVVSGDPRPQAQPTAEQRMWAYFVTEQSKGRTPTGAELDRVFSTNTAGACSASGATKAVWRQYRARSGATSVPCRSATMRHSATPDNPCRPGGRCGQLRTSDVVSAGRYRALRT